MAVEIDCNVHRCALQSAFFSSLLTAWQIGMYGWMAVATFVIFRQPLHQTSPLFWFMMQIGMFFGFVTSYPANWWLIKKGIKEAM